MNTNKNKLPLLLLLLLLLPSFSIAQSMRWIPASGDFGIDPCPPVQASKVQTLGFVLEYTPAVSGVLTSYTTGFLVSCSTTGTPIVKNQSISMTSKSREISACNTIGAVLMNSSGNSGSANRNTITAGVPVILHQICLNIPEGEVVTLLEDEVTDLTTSIDIGNGVYTTEYPTYETTTAGKARPDQGKPMLILDFKTVPLVPFISELDWSTSLVINHTPFIIERSMDGKTFAVIGSMDKGELTDQITHYQFLDKEAIAGSNYYRLVQVNPQGEKEYSPIRMVNFTPRFFSVTCTPNPADEYLDIHVQSLKEIKNITLVDATGRIVMEEKNTNKNFDTRLDVKKLTSGVYTLVVESRNDRYTENVVIAH